MTGLGVVKIDPLLEPYKSDLQQRWHLYKETKARIHTTEKGLLEFSKGYEKYGLLTQLDGSVLYREWAPQAVVVQLIGDFCNWNAKDAATCVRDEFGTWSVTLPPGVLVHGSAVKARLTGPDYSVRDIVPIWIKFAAPTHSGSVAYKGIIWDPPQSELESHTVPRPPKPKSLRIYEAHVGMCGEEPRIHSYREFADNIIPYIKELGYNAVQLMAIQEHAYYASYGYHVTSIFAVSSRFGTPEDFRFLVNKAHLAGILVLLDLVHAHASSNVADGPAGIDLGSNGEKSYFHEGERGHHLLWGSRCYDYANWETLRLLLSNIRWWLCEYNIDGFRFDGVSSMIFKNHAIGREFKGTYDDYFSSNTDVEAQVYLMLANELAQLLYPDVILIAEEVSGLPTLCRPISEGGLGFHYRLGMGFPDRVVELVEHYDSEREWKLHELVHALCFRRTTEKTIAYLESHDQALMGDQTVLFRLLKDEIYEGMSMSKPISARVERGIALHKVLRLLTFALGGEGYLCFMGNEFGHPEWIDFPREGNNNSYEQARRKWSLSRNPRLYYQYLLAFDKALMAMDEERGVLSAGFPHVSMQDEERRLIVAERRDCVFVFNFHESVGHLGVGLPGKYSCVLNTDEVRFGGKGRIDSSTEHFTTPGECYSRPCTMRVFIPPRTGAWFARVEL